VWLLLPEPADYRWLKTREDSPWYPTVRLFRQRRPKEWPDVIARVARELEGLVEMKAGGAGPDALADRARPKVPPRGADHDVAKSPRGIAVAAETRAGLMQFDPGNGAEGRSLDRYGEYLQPVLESIAGLTRAGETILEAGSGHGAHAIMLARVLGPDGHLLVYEDHPVTRRMLCHNLAANRIQNVTVMHRRLGRGAPEPPELRTDPPKADAASQDTDSVDDLRLERLDWLKVNAGANARAVLAGANESLWRLRPCLLVSATEKAAMPDMPEFCGSYGYRAWHVNMPYFNIGNFNCRTDDIFAGDGVVVVLAVPEEVEANISWAPLASW
jgi:hypothetical protein